MDPGEHQCFVRSIVGRDAKKRPNPALGIDSDRPKPLGVGGSTEYHGCHCPPREVLGVGAALLAVFVAYVRVQARVAGVAQDYCGPMAKPGRIFLIALTALWLGITPASLQLAWGPDGSWGLMAAALVAIMVGCVITAARRLLRASRFLRVSTP